MPVYQREEYFQILAAVIRRDAIVPFNCFLLLKTNQRVVCIVKANEPFEAKQLDKLKSFGVLEIYIREEDKPVYEEYLRQFFKTEEGKTVLKEIQSQQQSAVGITESVAEELGITIQKIEGDLAEASSKIIVTNDGAPEDLGKVKIEEETKSEQETVIDILKSKVEALSQEQTVRQKLTDEERKVVSGVTEKIEEELQKIKGKKELTDDDERRIQGVVEKIKEEIQRVRGIARKDGKKFQILDQQLDQVEKQVQNMLGSVVQAKKKGKKKTDIIVVQGNIEAVENQVRQLKRFVKPQKNGVAADVVAELISGLELNLNEQLDIQHFAVERTKELIREQIKQELKEEMKEELKKEIVEENPESAEKNTNVEESEEGEISTPSWRASAQEQQSELSEKAIDQSRMIQELSEKLKNSQKQYFDLKQKWDEFQATAQKRFSDQDKITAKNFSIQMRDLETSYVDMKNNAETLVDSSTDLCESMGVAPAEAPQVSAEQVKQVGKTLGGLDLPPEASESADPEQIKSENQVLRSQLENAKALVDNNNEKIRELQEVVDQSSPYIAQLEKESEDNRKTIKELNDKIQSLETANIELSETTNSAQKIATRSKQELQQRDEIIHQLREQIQMIDEELKMFKDKFRGIEPADILKTKDYDKKALSPEILSLLKAKDKMILEVQKDLENKTTEYKILEKANLQLKGQMDDSANLKKRMAQKFDRIEADREQMRRELDALKRRMVTAQNLLDQERKTITKITALTEELKKDRVEFMNKTTVAMKGYSEMMSKANSLNNSVQAEMQKNKKLNDQQRILKEKVKTLSSHLAEAERYIKGIEMENAQLKKKAKKQAA